MFDPFQISIGGEIVLHHPPLEIVSWACQIILAVLAVIGSIFAYHQVQEANKARQAQLIMQLDNRWDSKDMRAARSLFVKMREEISIEISRKHPLAPDGDKINKGKEEWTVRLAKLRAEKAEDYQTIISICGFFESVGMMVKRDYISKTDALGLFAGAILLIDRNMREHLVDRGKEMGVPKGFFEHALYLCDIAKAEASR